MKTEHRCPRCEQTLPLTAYRAPSRHVNGREYYGPYCRTCTNAYQKERRLERLAAGWVEPRKSTEETTRISWLRLLRLKGLTEETYLEMKTQQDNKCAICGTDTPWSRSTTWHVDHDHETGAVRGLLGSQCNQGLGLFKDDSNLLRLAAEYLEHHRNNTAAVFSPK